MMQQKPTNQDKKFFMALFFYFLNHCTVVLLSRIMKIDKNTVILDKPIKSIRQAIFEAQNLQCLRGNQGQFLGDSA